jgi:hypothetical protein
MSHDDELVFIYFMMGTRKIQVPSGLGLQDIMLNLDIRHASFIIYDPLVASVITFGGISLDVKYTS